MKNNMGGNKKILSSIDTIYWNSKEKDLKINDISIEAEIKEEFFKIIKSLKDGLVIKNKSEIVEAINKKMQKDNRRHAIILVDLDDFKFINETFGYEAGDFILDKVESRISKDIRKIDYIFKHNGDEFIIFLENIESKEALESILNDIMKSFYTPILYKNKQVYVNISAGVAVSPENGVEFYNLLKHADGALTIAKRNGKGNYSFYDQSMSKEVNRSYDIQRCLRTAIDNKELYIVFQPKVFVENKVVRGAEALLRWKSKELGNVSPAELIPIAEMTRLIIPISTFVLEEVFKKIRYLLDLGHSDFKIAVNLSELQLRYDTILKDLLEFRELYDVDLKYIEIEITESILMKSFTSAWNRCCSRRCRR